MPGISGLSKGSLNDEDFPPLTVPYSSTMSSQSGGRLGYMTADLGYGFAINPATTVSLFAGYGYVGEKVNAYGCNQVGSNPFICVPTIGANVLGITEDAHWHAARLGVGVEFKPIEKLTLSLEAAWLPVVQLRSHDTHWLRLGSTFGSFSGPIPETGGRHRLPARGAGVLSGVGLLQRRPRRPLLALRRARLRRPRADGRRHHQSGAQPIEFTSERYGVFLQGSYKFNL